MTGLLLKPKSSEWIAILVLEYYIYILHLGPWILLLGLVALTVSVLRNYFFVWCTNSIVVLKTDPTVAPSKNSDFLQRTFRCCSTQKRIKQLKTKYPYFLVCKGLSIDDLGVSRDTTVFREIRPGAGFETGDFVKEKLGAGGGRTGLPQRLRASERTHRAPLPPP